MQFWGGKKEMYTEIKHILSHKRSSTKYKISTEDCILWKNGIELKVSKDNRKTSRHLEIKWHTYKSSGAQKQPSKNVYEYTDLNESTNKIYSTVRI